MGSQRSFVSLEGVFEFYFLQREITENMKKEIFLIKQAQERVQRSETSKNIKDNKQHIDIGSSELKCKISDNSLKTSKSNLNESTNNFPINKTCKEETKIKKKRKKLKEKSNQSDGVNEATADLTNAEINWECHNCTNLNPEDVYVCKYCSICNSQMKKKIGNAKGAISKSRKETMANVDKNSCLENPTADHQDDDLYNIKKTKTTKNSFINESIEIDNSIENVKIHAFQENLDQMTETTSSFQGIINIIKKFFGFLPDSRNQKAQEIENKFNEILRENSWETLDEEIKKIYRRLIVEGLDEGENGFQLAVLKYLMPQIDDHFILYVFNEQNFKIEATLKKLLIVCT